MNTHVKNNCPFCLIVSGDLKTPGIFWEDQKYMAFLSIEPNTEGFSCVIPKHHYGSDVINMPDEELKEFILAAKKVSSVLEQYYMDVGRVGLIMEGTGIDHAHIKLIPMHNTEFLKDGGFKEIASSQGELYTESYEGYLSSTAGPRASDEHLAQLAANIKQSIT